MRTKTVSTLAALLVIGGLSTAVVWAAAEIGKAAPDFTLKDHTGKEVKLADLKGKIVVLEWFNAGCPVTQRHHSKETPTMKTTAEKYKDKGVVWYAVASNSDGSVEGNAKAAQEMGVAYGILDDASGKVGKAYGAKATPHMFIIDAKGNLAYAGAIDDNANGNKARSKNYVAQALDELLAGTTVSEPRTQQYGCGIKYSR